MESNQALINGNTIFKSSSELIIQSFGQPLNIEDYYFETENATGQLYSYDDMYFYFINNKVESFEIFGNQYSFTSNNILVGNQINTLQSLYPDSFSNRALGEVIIPFSDADSFITIRYSSQNIIEKIELNSY